MSPKNLNNVKFKIYNTVLLHLAIFLMDNLHTFVRNIVLVISILSRLYALRDLSHVYYYRDHNFF